MSLAWSGSDYLTVGIRPQVGKSQNSRSRGSRKNTCHSGGRETGNGAKDLKGHCAAKHIAMILVKNAYCETRQVFVPIKDRNALLSFRPAHVFNKPQAANRNRPNRQVLSLTDRLR